MPEIKKLDLETINPRLNVTLVKDSIGLEAVADFIKRVDEFGFDVETNMTDNFFTRKIRTIQIGNKNEQYVIDFLQFCNGEEELKQQGQQSFPSRNHPSWATEIVETIRPGLESATHLKLGVNLQFDYEQVRWCLGLRPFNFYCCHLAEKVLYTGKIPFHAKDFWGMEDMVRRYCKVIISKDEQKTFDLSTELTQAQIDYAALDTRFPFAIRSGQLVEIKKAELEHIVFDVEMPAIMSFGDMHLAGFGISQEKWKEQIVRVEEKHKFNIEDMDQFFIPIVGDKADGPDLDKLRELEIAWRDEKNKEARKKRRQDFMEYRKRITKWNKDVLTYDGQARINYGSGKQVLAALKKMGVKLENTDDNTLEEIDHPAVVALREFRTTNKLLSTYGEGFLVKYVDKNTGRIHSSINQIGADSGRTSSVKPNIQNIVAGMVGEDGEPIYGESDSPYRECFVSKDGYSLIIRDYDGCELRCIAELSGEEEWIKAFNEGRDVHSLCAALMYGDKWKEAALEGCAYYAKGKKCKCPEHKKMRDYAKQINFGIPYGMGEKKLARKLKVTPDEARKLLELHAKMFPKVHAYLKKSADDAKMNLEARTIGKRRRLFTKPEWDIAREKALKKALKKGKKFVTDKQVQQAYFGMWGNIEREGKNTPIQGFNADLVKIAMGLTWHTLELQFGATIVNVVHDELVTECPDNLAEEASKFIGECMEKAGTIYIKKVKMVSSGNISKCWAKD